MHTQRLKQAEKKFLKKYPGGFHHPDMVAIGKKHKMSKMIDLARDSFHEDAFADPKAVVVALSKVVTSSSMVSMFEKPKFRDFAKTLKPNDRGQLCDGLFEMLHGKQGDGFEAFQEVLMKQKLAKWTLMTVVPSYMKATREVFVKPSTTKHVIEHFELDLKYNATPTWAFYRKYRTAINKMKREVDKSLSPSNAAFTGFLMMTMP